LAGKGGLLSKIETGVIRQDRRGQNRKERTDVKGKKIQSSKEGPG